MIRLCKRRCRRECLSLDANSPTHALSANRVLGHLGWHTDSSVGGSKYAIRLLQQLVRNEDRTRGHVSPAQYTLHIHITAKIRPGDVDS